MNPGALLLNSGVTFTSPGVITLLGPGSTFTASQVIALTPPAAACRITGQNADTYEFEGVITGTGALDLCSSPANSVFEFNNTTANNIWSGGLIIETPVASPSAARTVELVFPASGNGFGGVTQIPHGAGKGDVMLYSASAVSGSLARLNLENNSITINGLYGFSAGVMPANVVVENSDNVLMSTLTIGDGNANGYYAGVVLDPNGKTAITKIGTGTQVFTGTMVHQGPTTISAGTFELSGSGGFILPPDVSPSPITIAPGATLDASERTDGTLTLLTQQSLGGSGTVIGTLAEASGSTVSEGTSTTIGTLANTGMTELQGGGTNVVKVQDAMTGPGVGNDVLAVSGVINVQATSASPFTIALTSLNAGAPGNVANFVNTSTYTWTIATGSSVTGFSPGAFTVNTAGFSNPLGSGQFFVGNTGTSLVLVFVPTGNDVGSIINPAINGSGNPTLSGSGGIPGYMYGVESAPTVKGPWSEAGNVTPAANGSWSFTDSSQHNPITIFYRVYFPDNPSNPPQ